MLSANSCPHFSAVFSHGHRKGTPPVAEIAHFFFFNTYISTFLVQLEPAAHPHGFHQLCLKYQVLTDSRWWWGSLDVGGVVIQRGRGRGWGWGWGWGWGGEGAGGSSSCVVRIGLPEDTQTVVCAVKTV